MIRIIKTKKVEKLDAISFIEKEGLRKNVIDQVRVGVAKMKKGTLRLTLFSVRPQTISKIGTYKIKDYRKGIRILTERDVIVIDKNLAIYPGWFRTFLRHSDEVIKYGQHSIIQDYSAAAARFARFGISVRKTFNPYDIKVGRGKMFIDQGGTISIKVWCGCYRVTGGHVHGLNTLDKRFVNMMDTVAVKTAALESDALAEGFPMLTKVGRTIFTFKKDNENHQVMLQLSSKYSGDVRTATLTHFTYVDSSYTIENIVIDIDYNKMTNIYAYLGEVLKDVEKKEDLSPTEGVVDSDKGITAKELAECVMCGLDEKDESNAFFTGYTPQRLFNATDTNLQFPPALVPQGLAGMMLEIKAMGDSLLESIKNDSPINPSLRNIEILKAYGKTLGVDMKLTEASRFAMLNQAKEAEDVESPEIETTTQS